MALEIWDWDTFKRKAQEDEKKHGKQYQYEIDLITAWLDSGARIVPIDKDGMGLYLFNSPSGMRIMIGYTYSKVINDFCASDRLMYEGFILVPNGYVLRKGRKCPDWFVRTGKYDV